MKRMILLLSCFFTGMSLWSQASKAEIAIIPVPVKLVQSGGVFNLPNNISITAPSDPELQTTITFLQKRLSTATGNTVAINNQSTASTIQLVLNKSADAVIGSEGYYLTVAPTSIVIKANKPRGYSMECKRYFNYSPKKLKVLLL
jgi:hexosaminidase